MKKALLFLALAATLLHVTPGFLLDDLPRSLSVSWHAAPWRWDWRALLWMAVHSAALFIVVSSAGLRASRLFRLGAAGWFDRLAMGAGLGVGMAGLAVLGLGLAGLMRPGILLGLAGLLAVNAFSMVLGGARNAGPTPVRGQEGLPGWERIAMVALAGWAALVMAGTLLAPEGYWDALVVHLAAPRKWLESGRIVQGYPFFSGFPVLMPMNYALALAVRGPDAARGFNALLGLSVALAAWGLGRTWLDARAGARAGLLVATSPLLLLLSVHAGADTGATLMAVLAVLSLARSAPSWPRGKARVSWLALAGVFAGLAYGAKPHGGLVILLVLLLSMPFGWRAALAPALGALAACLPWLVRGWFTTGDPAYPLLGFLFHGPFWSDFSRDVYGAELLAVRDQISWGDYRFWAPEAGGISRFKLGLTGPAAPLSAAFALAAGVAALSGRDGAGPRIRGAAPMVLAFAGGLSVLWAFTVPAWRFFAAGLALLPLLLVLPEYGAVARFASRAALLLQAVWWPLVATEVDRPWAAARGEETREEYYRALHVNPALDACGFLEQKGLVGPRSRLLATGEMRGYLLPPWSVVASHFEEAPLVRLAADSPDPRRLGIRLRQMGVDYLLVNVPEMTRSTVVSGLCWRGPFPVGTLEAFFRRNTELVYARSNAWIYRVSRGGRGARGAELPECFRTAEPRRTISMVESVRLSAGAVAAGEPREAVKRAFAAVAAREDSGMAWAALGNAFYLAGRWTEAAEAYDKALRLGWKTSTVYRNRSIVFLELNDRIHARESMEAAFRIDPNRQFGSEMREIQEASFRPYRRILGEK